MQKPQELTREHLVANFDCGDYTLNQYLIRRALKSSAVGDARVFVVCGENQGVVGYYSISAASVPRKQGIRVLRRNAPDPIPMALIGRLAVHNDYQNQGIGSSLLRDAIFRIVQASEQLGIRGIFLHTHDDRAKSFYLRHGFKQSNVDKKLLMISLAAIGYELDRGSVD